MLENREPCYTKLLVEFLASFNLNKKGIDYEKLGVSQFCLGGKQFALSISEFGIALSLYRELFIMTELY